MFSTSPSIISICSGVRFFMASAACFICSGDMGPPGGGSMRATVRGAVRADGATSADAMSGARRARREARIVLCAGERLKNLLMPQRALLSGASHLVTIPRTLVMIHAATAAALAPVTRRAALVGASSSFVALPAFAAGNPDAAKVRASQLELKEILAKERNFRSGVLAGLPEGSARLPTAISFITFQKLEKSASNPDDFMAAAVEYAESYRNARDLVKLAVLGRGAGADVAAGYYDRALPEIKDAAAKLDEAARLLPP